MSEPINPIKPEEIEPVETVEPVKPIEPVAQVVSHSPVFQKVEKVEEAEIMQKTRVIEEKKQMDFSEAIVEVINRKKITRIEWESKGSYVFLDPNTRRLTIYLSDINKDHDWIISQSDLDSKDWVIA